MLFAARTAIVRGVGILEFGNARRSASIGPERSLPAALFLVVPEPLGVAQALLDLVDEIEEFVVDACVVHVAELRMEQISIRRATKWRLHSPHARVARGAQPHRR